MIDPGLSIKEFHDPSAIISLKRSGRPQCDLEGLAIDETICRQVSV